MLTPSFSSFPLPASAARLRLGAELQFKTIVNNILYKYVVYDPHPLLLSPHKLPSAHADAICVHAHAHAPKHRRHTPRRRKPVSPRACNFHSRLSRSVPPTTPSSAEAIIQTTQAKKGPSPHTQNTKPNPNPLPAPSAAATMQKRLEKQVETFSALCAPSNPTSERSWAVSHPPSLPSPKNRRCDVASIFWVKNLRPS